MNTISRKLRKSARDDDINQGSLPTRDDFQPIDTQQQEELVRSFERKHEKQSSLWRGVFSTILFCFAFFLTYSIFQQTWWPWDLRYHAYFMGEVESSNLVSAEAIAVLACLMAARGLLHQDFEIRRQFISYSCYIGLLLAIFWLLHMWRMPKFQWDVIWLPLGPLSGALICLYVDHLLADSLEEIRKLRSSMLYRLKGLSVNPLVLSKGITKVIRGQTKKCEPAHHSIKLYAMQTRPSPKKSF